MVKTDCLNEAIKSAGLRKDSIAASLGISKQSLSNKINNKTEFKAGESNWLRKTLNLSSERFVGIFFADEYDSKSYLENAHV